MDCKQICIDFVEGKIDYKLFVEKLNSNVELIDWIDSVGRKWMFSYKRKEDYTMEQIPFSIRHNLKSLSWSLPNSIGYRLNLHGCIRTLLMKQFPEELIIPSTLYRDKFDLYMDSCPDYIDGPEVWKSGIIDKIIDECPEEWSKSKKIKAIKQKIKEEFHIEKSDYPRWIQVPDWPFSNGKPMKYVGKTIVRKGEWIKHHFVDVETGEERVVDDMD